MNDTPKHILEKQFEIIYSKPLQEKILHLFDLTELSRKLIESQLKEKNPHFSEIELKIELFKCFYKYEFKSEKLREITDKMREYFSVNLK